MLIHVADNVIGLLDLRNLAERLVGVPFEYLAGLALGVLAGGTVMQEPVEIVRVGRIGHHHRTVGCGALGGDQIGAGIGFESHSRKGGERPVDNRSLHMLCFCGQFLSRRRRHSPRPVCKYN